MTPTTPHHRIGRLLAGALLATAVALAGLMLVPALFGYQRYVVTGGSMTGTYDRGSLIFDRTVPTAQLREGDVITFRPPPSAGLASRGMVTHRIVAITHGQDGSRVYRTKGDANRSSDPYAFGLHNATQARVAFHVPYVGYVFAALGIRWVRMLIIGLPALLVALAVLAGLWRDAGHELRRRPTTSEAPSA
jgi:signal peptidase I